MKKHRGKHKKTEFGDSPESFNEQNFSPESWEVVSCMREQIAIGDYPGDGVVDKTVETLQKTLEEN